MPLIVPNVQDATFPTMARRYSEWDAIFSRSAGGRYGVISGCTVSAQVSPNMTVAVAAGQIKWNNDPFSITGGNVTIDPADGVFDRWDLIVAGIENDIFAVTGTAEDPPVPDLYTGAIVVAAVFVPAGTTAITSDHILDTTISVPPPLGEAQWTTLTAATDTSRSNAGTATDDPILTFACGTGDTYRIRGMVWVFLQSATFATMLKYGFTMPASLTYGHARVREGSILRSSPGTGAATLTGADNVRTFRDATIDANCPTFTGQASPGLIRTFEFEAFLQTGVSLGDFAFKWTGQHASDAAVRLAGSYMEYELV